MKLLNKYVIFFVLIITTFVTLFIFIIDIFWKDVIDKSSLLIAKSVERIIHDESNYKLAELSESRKNRLRIKIKELVDDNKSILNILLIDENLKILLSSDKSVEGNIYIEKNQVGLFNAKEQSLHRQVWEKELQVIDIIKPLYDEHNVFYAYLRVVLIQPEIYPYLNTLQRYIIPLIIIFGLLIILVFFFVTKSLKKPITLINKAISKMDEEDYNYRFQYKKNSEYTDTFFRLNKTIEKVGYLKEGYKKTKKHILSLLQAVNDGIVILDSDKSVTSFNDTAAKILKTSKEKFAESFKKTLDLNTDFTNMIYATLKKGIKVQDKQVTLFLPDQTNVLMRINLQSMEENGNILGAVITIKDQRSIEELENNLIRSMKFGVITSLASSISHEIKNPLSSLLLHTEILQSNLNKEKTKNNVKINKSLNTIENEIQRLNRIIQQFFSLAKPSKFELTLVNINYIIQDVIELVEKEAKEKNILLSSKLSSSLEMVYGDEDQLKQVFINIILNAIAAIQSGGEIKIHSEMIKGKVTIYIKDTGHGIPEHLRKQIFELYFSTKKDGAGIGLAVCKNIIKAHEGEIDFKSKINSGTTFTITFPAKDQSTIYNTHKSSRKNVKKSNKCR